MVDWRPQTRHGVPARNRLEPLFIALTATTALVADRDIVKHAGVGIEGGVGKSNWALTLRKSLLVDAVEDRGNNWCGHGGTAASVHRAAEDNNAVIAKRSDIRISTAGAVVDAKVGRDLAAAGGVRREAGIVV